MTVKEKFVGKILGDLTLKEIEQLGDWSVWESKEETSIADFTCGLSCGCVSEEYADEKIFVLDGNSVLYDPN